MLQITVNNNAFAVSNDDGAWQLDGQQVDCDIEMLSNGLINVIYKNKSYTAILEHLDEKSKELIINIEGQSYTIAIKEPLDQLLEKMGMDLSALQKAEPIKAPMPGMILKILVEPGQQISKGDGILILEAMKMENVLKASGDATVKAINVEENTAVEKGAVLIELE